MHIAILGAGPIGLDAALAAHEAGFPFTVYESGREVAANVRAWGHVRLFTPWSMNLSARMRNRLGVGTPTTSDECPTGVELVQQVLSPVAALPDLAANLRLGTEVVAVSRAGLVKSDEIGTGARSNHPFRVLIRDAHGERVEPADVVLDCTGTYGHPNPTGDGGIPAPGERGLADRIERRIPDVAGSPELWAGQSVLVVGAGHSAQTAVTDLQALAASSAGTHATWVLRSPAGRIEPIENDPLSERARLTARANEILAGGSPHVSVLAGWVVDELRPGGDAVVVILRNGAGRRRSVEVDRVVSLTGSVGDPAIYRQLQVHECWATSGPMKLAATLLGEAGGDCLQQTSHGVAVLESPEPRFYMLGSKSYGRNNTFLLRVGYEQVGEVFDELKASTASVPATTSATATGATGRGDE